MARFSLRTAFTALALGVAAIGASTLTSTEASAKPFQSGGWGKHHGHFHGHFHGGWGFRRVGFYAPVVPVVYGGCTVRKFVTYDGDVVIKRRCY